MIPREMISLPSFHSLSQRRWRRAKWNVNIGRKVTLNGKQFFDLTRYYNPPPLPTIRHDLCRWPRCRLMFALAAPSAVLVGGSLLLISLSSIIARTWFNLLLSRWLIFYWNVCVRRSDERKTENCFPDRKLNWFSLMNYSFHSKLNFQT